MMPAHTIACAPLMPDVIVMLRDLFGTEVGEAAADTPLDTLPGWDSMSLVRVVVAAECRFAIAFAQSEIEGLGTIGHLVETIAAKRLLCAP